MYERKREIDCSDSGEAAPIGDRIHRMTLMDSRGEFYIFFFPASRRDEVLQTCERFAGNPNLGFSGLERDFVAAVMRKEFDA